MLPPPLTRKDVDAYNAERLRSADTLLLGRTTYEQFKAFRRYVEDDPKAAALPKEISRLNNAIDKVVISDSLTANEADPWHNTTIVRRADAYGKIAELKRRPGKDILIFGSRTLWNFVQSDDVADEAIHGQHALHVESGEAGYVPGGDGGSHVGAEQVFARSRARANFSSCTSTATMGHAPLALAPMTVAKPTPPMPKTTTLAPNSMLAVFVTAPTPVRIAQPNSAALSKGMSGSMTVTDASSTTVNSEKAATDRW